MEFRFVFSDHVGHDLITTCWTTLPDGEIPDDTALVELKCAVEGMEIKSCMVRAELRGIRTPNKTEAIRDKNRALEGRLAAGPEEVRRSNALVASDAEKLRHLWDECVVCPDKFRCQVPCRYIPEPYLSRAIEESADRVVKSLADDLEAAIAKHTHPAVESIVGGGKTMTAVGDDGKTMTVLNLAADEQDIRPWAVMCPECGRIGHEWMPCGCGHYS